MAVEESTAGDRAGDGVPIVVSPWVRLDETACHTSRATAGMCGCIAVVMATGRASAGRRQWPRWQLSASDRRRGNPKVMARKRKPAKKRDPNQITAAGPPDEDTAVTIARTVLCPTVQAAVTLREYGKSYGDLELSGLIDALAAQTKAVTDGDLGRGEAMLAVQAHTLDAVFNNLAQRAINTEYVDNFDRYLKLAFRAQSQCRATWETLVTMKNPPTMGYVRQANIAHGPQQVNQRNLDSGRPVAPEGKREFAKQTIGGE